MFFGASPIVFELAKKLRTNVTHAEMILWERLKEAFPDTKFRRQYPISFYIVDLYCHSKKLLIEIDGSIHNLEEIKTKDEIRQKDLENLGIKVIRFANKEVMNNLEQTLQKIEKYLK